MATGNDRVNAIQKLIKLGLEVHFKEIEDTATMVISVTRDNMEVGYVMDKTIGTGSEKKLIPGSALNSFVEKVDAGWPEQ